MGGDVVQLVEHRIGKPLMQVRVPEAARNFFSQSTFSADSLTVLVHPRVQLHALIYMCNR